MRFLLIRHGKMSGDPFCRPERPVSGCLSEDLGVLQAQATAQALAGYRIDVALSSPYGRALQTCEIVMNGRDAPIHIVDELHEWLPADKLGGSSSTEYEKMTESVKDRYAEEEWKTELGEGCYDMYARVIPAFLKALSGLGIHMRMGGFVPDSGAEDLSVAVFAHGGSLGVILPFLLGARPFPKSSVGFELTGAAFIDFSEQQGIYYPVLRIPALHDMGKS